MDLVMCEKQRTEAISRMESMGIREDVRAKFEKDGTVMRCVSGRFRKLTEVEKEEIRQFEQEHDATVFLSVHMLTMYGNLDALLFVSQYEEEWEMDRQDILDGYALSYCMNRDYPDCSEMGSILFRTTDNGCIIRIG